MKNSFTIDMAAPFNVNITRSTLTVGAVERNSSLHIHDVCEIYVNVSGNVSFIVGKNLYSIQPGDIIFARPFEYHRCVYNDDSAHDHFWITFSSEENPELFRFIIESTDGSNLLRLPEDMSDKVLSFCDTLASSSDTTPATTLSAFFGLISYIEYGFSNYNISAAKYNNLPENVRKIIAYINNNFKAIKNIRSLAGHFHISIATLERYFSKYIFMTPHRYIETKKLSHACMLLRQNASVTDACFDSGFDDYSYFISVFKKNMHTTPLKYKNEPYSL